MSNLRVAVSNGKIPTRDYLIDKVVTIGRRDLEREDPLAVALRSVGDRLKLVVVDDEDQHMPRSWFAVIPRSKGGFTVKNIHGTRSIEFVDDIPPIESGASRSFERAVLIDMGGGIEVLVEPHVVVDSGEPYQQLKSDPPVPGQAGPYTGRSIGKIHDKDAEDFLEMLRLALQVVQKSAASDAFFQAATSAMVDIVKLDRSVIVLKGTAASEKRIADNSGLPDHWNMIAEYTSERAPKSSSRGISATLFRKVVDEGATVIYDPMNDIASRDVGVQVPSLNEVDFAVAAPILSGERDVIGVLYGDRRAGEQRTAVENRITVVEATCVEVFAGAVAAGIARCSEERLRTTLAGFFSAKVADLLATTPSMMDGQDCQVTVLFCDIRGFSTATEKLVPKKAIEWINDVMSELSQCVIDLDGVLVDYVGDELLAMWGAPGEQPDHAVRAIKSAKAMISVTRQLAKRWGKVLPHQFGVGIGINTGLARVGNVGSRQKFKYGALGNTVNVGARLQSATKQLGVSCLASGATIEAASVKGSRRIANVGVVGIEQPIQVHELNSGGGQEWDELRIPYQSALKDFEDGKFAKAIRRLGAILTRHHSDRPSRALLSRAISELDEPSEKFTGVWRLKSK